MQDVSINSRIAMTLSHDVDLIDNDICYIKFIFQRTYEGPNLYRT